MSVKSFVEDHKGVRRTILAVSVLWISAAVGAGLYQVIHGGLGGNDVAFLTTLVGLLQVPIGFYFYRRP